MVDHVTDGVGSTGSGAGIHALVADTGAISGAVCIQNTLRATARVGVTLVLGNARALAVLALSIRSTWGRIARIVENDGLG